MKVALCFIIKDKLHKENIWKKWITYNSFLFNVYFFYKNKHSITSSWILQHCIPEKYILPTSYFHIVPAYISLMEYAYHDDPQNKWFCFLTESCVPIIPPPLFLTLFYQYHRKSILKWEYSKWNIDYHRRANLKYLHKKYHLCNTPWFLLERSHVYICIQFVILEPKMFSLICKGGIANESIFAIILRYFDQLKYVINENSTIMDWSRMTTSTSPYVFSSEKDMESIYTFIKKNKYGIFLRKIHKDFPEELLENILFSSLTFPPIITFDTSYKCCHWFIRRTSLHLIISTFLRMTFSTLECICRSNYICFTFIFCSFILCLN